MVVETRGERNIRWIEEYCIVPEGKLVGQKMVLRDWQKVEIRKIYDNPAGTRMAILSFARKNGKTALAACLCLLHLCGPEAVQNSQLYSAAQSRDQAAVLFGLAAKMVRMSPSLAAYVRPVDSGKRLICQEIGTVYEAMSADAKVAHGRSPIFVVHDELGQVKGPRSELFEAMETGSGAHESPLSIVISTQAPTDADLLSTLIDRAKDETDPRLVLSLYTAPEDSDPFDVEQIRLANPAYGDFLSENTVQDEITAARDMPSQEAAYRNLRLNQRVNANSPFMSESVWRRCAGEVPSLDGMQVFAGLDLSEVSDLTAFVLVGKKDGKYFVEPQFWLPEDGIVEKSRQDRRPYDYWARQGYLNLTPGPAIDYEFVAAQIVDYFSRYDIQKIAFDRYRMRHLRPWLAALGMPEEDYSGENAIMQEFGQGFMSMSPALMELEAAALKGQLVHPDHPVMNMCAMNAKAIRNPAGDRKLTKEHRPDRIDGMVALTMALSVAVEGGREDVAPEYQAFFI